MQTLTNIQIDIVFFLDHFYFAATASNDQSNIRLVNFERNGFATIESIVAASIIALTTIVPVATLVAVTPFISIVEITTPIVIAIWRKRICRTSNTIEIYRCHGRLVIFPITHFAGFSGEIKSISQSWKHLTARRLTIEWKCGVSGNRYQHHGISMNFQNYRESNKNKKTKETVRQAII